MQRTCAAAVVGSVGEYRLSAPPGTLDSVRPALPGLGVNWIRATKLPRLLRLAASVLLRLLLVILPVVLAGVMAHRMVPNGCCDEYIHLNAFEYFRTHWLMPKPGSSEVVYSINGISRVFNGEIVYFLFGKIGYFPRRIWPNINPYYVYRYCNIGLLAIMLGVLAFARCKWFAPWLLGMVLICIPQVIYLFSYANSDAFGVFASVLLFVQAARMLDQRPRDWSLLRIGTFMLLLLLTLLSKIAFEMCILLPLALLVFHLVRSRASLKFIALKLFVPLLIVYTLASWWNPQLSPRGAAWHRQMMALREEKGIVGRRPSDPQVFEGVYPFTLKASYIAANHGTYSQVIRFDHYAWFPLSGESFYGRFGYMLVVLPPWIYMGASSVAIALLLLTIAALWRVRRSLPPELVLCIALAPLLIGFNIFGSLYHSFHYDWQPQGRYLFASLVPVFFLCCGSWSFEGRLWRWIRGIVLCLLIPLSCYALIQYVVLNPTLQGPFR